MSANTEAAPVLLGSNLLRAARIHDTQRRAPASSGSAVIDEKALDGGFRYGEITSIAGSSGMGKTLVGLIIDISEMYMRIAITHFIVNAKVM